MTDTEKLKALIAQVEKVQALQDRFFSGEKTVLTESRKEEKKLKLMTAEFKIRESQSHLF
jgi:hypothetical protein